MEGGLFDQDPMLLKRFEFIFKAQGEEEERKERQRKREENAKMGTRTPQQVHRP